MQQVSAAASLMCGTSLTLGRCELQQASSLRSVRFALSPEVPPSRGS